MWRMAIAVTAMMTAAAFAPSRADDQWRFCVAQDETGRRFFITDAFPSSVALDELERSFNDWLDKSANAHRWGICPRSSSAFDAAADVQSAVKYNRRMGFAQQPVSWPETRS